MDVVAAYAPWARYSANEKDKFWMDLGDFVSTILPGADLNGLKQRTSSVGSYTISQRTCATSLLQTKVTAKSTVQNMQEVQL